MDGQNRTKLVDSKIVFPHGITLDLVNRLVYWADAYLDYIEVVDYEGKNRHTIIQGLLVSFEALDWWSRTNESATPCFFSFYLYSRACSFSLRAGLIDFTFRFVMLLLKCALLVLRLLRSSFSSWTVLPDAVREALPLHCGRHRENGKSFFLQAIQTLHQANT